MQRTLAIIKPDAVRRRLTGEILRRVEADGFALRALRVMRLTRSQAEAFYAEHRARPFFKSLCEYMTSGPIVVAALEGEDAVARWRELMGATDPKKAEAGTIRKEFGIDVEQNSSHGSDAPATAARELAFFFSELDIVA